VLKDQSFYGHGKLLLTSEYFVMDGSLALAIPTSVGQSMKIKYKRSDNPALIWKSLDAKGVPWFETSYEFWHFENLKKHDSPEYVFLKEILLQVRKQNPHFLRDNVDVYVETQLEFPIEWGLGSSSSLIYNIAQWAYVSPFELLEKTCGGSGYDIACAQSMGPIHFKKEKNLPQWNNVNFNPSFMDNLYFIYLGRKQKTQESVKQYREKKIENKQSIIDELTLITKEMTTTQSLETFNKLMLEHENLISKSLGFEKVQDLHFSDYWGKIKSLGAWGGDFALVTSDRTHQETREYFANKGFNTFINFRELMYCGPVK
jgi:mevalonate kinase